jgi:hypothetical protein
VALGIVLAPGLIVMPAIEKVQASNPSNTRNKGQQGELTRALPRNHPGLGCSPWDPRC